MATAMEIARESECSSSSNSSSKESSSEDEIFERSSLIEPYSNEPLASSGYEFEDNVTDDEDGISSETLGQRFDKEVPVNSWCQCGRCSDRHLSSAREYRCCKEILECQGKYKFEGKDAACIVEHWDYLPMVHKAVLKNVGPLLKSKDGKKYKQKKNQSENEYLRAVAYRWLVLWLCGYLGWDHSRSLPACIYDHIRSEFPSSDVQGYKGARQRQKNQ